MFDVVKLSEINCVVVIDDLERMSFDYFGEVEARRHWFVVLNECFELFFGGDVEFC